MRNVARTVAVLLLCGSSSIAYGQSRIEAGLLLDYLNVSQTHTNNFGLGGRFGYRVHRNVMLEGELTYGYGVNFSEAYRDITNGDVKAIEKTSIGVTDGLFGPALQPAHGHLRPAQLDADLDGDRAQALEVARDVGCVLGASGRLELLEVDRVAHRGLSTGRRRR